MTQFLTINFLIVLHSGNEGVRNDVNYNEFVVQQPNNRNQRRNLNQIQNENILPGLRKF